MLNEVDFGYSHSCGEDTRHGSVNTIRPGLHEGRANVQPKAWCIIGGSINVSLRRKERNMEDMRQGSGREWGDSVKNQIKSVRVPNCMLKTIKWSRHCLHSTQVPQNPLYLDPSLICSGLELPELLQVET